MRQAPKAKSGRQVLSNTPNGAARLEALAAATKQARALGIQHYELIEWCRERWLTLALPALYSETFDIPKNEEEAALAREHKRVVAAAATAAASAKSSASVSADAAASEATPA